MAEMKELFRTRATAAVLVDTSAPILWRRVYAPNAQVILTKDTLTVHCPVVPHFRNIVSIPLGTIMTFKGNVRVHWLYPGVEIKYCEGRHVMVLRVGFWYRELAHKFYATLSKATRR